METLIVYYDAACPGCRRDQRRYDRLAGAGTVQWCDINGREELLRDKGIDPDEARLKLHIEHADGRIEKDIESYIVLLGRIFWLRPLAWLISWSPLREWLRRRYRASVQQRLSQTGYCQNCDSDTSASRRP